MISQKMEHEWVIGIGIGSVVGKDQIIINRMLSPLASKEVIVKKIKRFYLGHHFSKYEANVYLFNFCQKLSQNCLHSRAHSDQVHIVVFEKNYLMFDHI